MAIYLLCVRPSRSRDIDVVSNASRAGWSLSRGMAGLFYAS